MLQNFGFIGVPIFFRYLGNNEGEMKLENERYEMFVNGEYIGEHTLYAEKEEATDIGDFLDHQGYHHVQIDVEGDHIMIHCQDKSEADRVEQALRVFIHNR
ncbi:hypothetical protein CR194_18415 [Salipaludibacillus keqinensis]|jgi:hypothetical protein|uniref:Uncharacterized protein n=1 Tax=Salipaludibacillus keqinensis TaxID=2045207 RepID=A0A323T4T7_9BACI|nr:hypothetical protein [Salipaludibacillus keqinensis]PYZ91608.1 hypothetical protein CR194_18415 [Salipaludibacillus keqinensis]